MHQTAGLSPLVVVAAIEVVLVLQHWVIEIRRGAVTDAEHTRNGPEGARLRHKVARSIFRASVVPWIVNVRKRARPERSLYLGVRVLDL